MISTFLVEHASLVRVAFWVAIVLVLVIGWVLNRIAARTGLLILGTMGLIGALVLTMSPEGDRSTGAFCTVQFSVPFQGIDTLANVAMLVPLTLFLGLATKRPVLIFASVSGLSAVLELVQALIPALGRSCDTDDWLMNTVGALLGALGALGILVLDRRRQNSGGDR